MVECKDCGKPYQDFGIDFVLPDQQWNAIHPQGHDGLLCAHCIGARASALGATAVMCWLNNIDYSQVEEQEQLRQGAKSETDSA